MYRERCGKDNPLNWPFIEKELSDMSDVLPGGSAAVCALLLQSVVVTVWWDSLALISLGGSRTPTLIMAVIC